MTILTKAITDKKFDKSDDQPLVQNEFNESMVKPVPVAAKSVSVELPAHVYLSRTRARRVNTATTICACITAILVLTVGVIGGVYLYRKLATAQMHRVRAWCKVPYTHELDMMYGGGNGNRHVVQAKQTGYQDYHDHEESFGDKLMSAVANGGVSSSRGLPLFFDEGVEIDIEFHQYEEITVPDFSGGRRGRFIHDFSANMTGIIDLDGRRCFVMPLNRSIVLPPQSLFDLVLKLKAGYYEVDTEVVRETMQVLHPRITDYKSVGYYIARECSSLNTFMLRRVPRYERSRSKRNSDADPMSKPFTMFGGKKIIQYNIVDLKEFEK